MILQVPPQKQLTSQGGKSPFLIGDTSSNGCFPSVMLVFGDVTKVSNRDDGFPNCFQALGSPKAIIFYKCLPRTLKLAARP